MELHQEFSTVVTPISVALMISFVIASLLATSFKTEYKRLQADSSGVNDKSLLADDWDD